MGSKSSAPSTDTSAYSAIASADTTAAELSAQSSANSLAWSQQQYAQEWPYVQSYMNAMTGEMNQSTASATEQQSRLENIYYPIENQFATTAQTYDTPSREAQASAAAQADVSNSYNAQRTSALQSLESYGIDPSQTRYGAMDLGARVSQAASSASAGTQARLNTEATGLSLEGEAINIGRGYPNSIAQSYSTAQSAGSSGVNAGLNTSTTYGNLMGTATQWGSLSTSDYNSAANAVNTAFSNELSSYNASTSASQNAFGGIGSLVGGLGAASIIAF